MKRWFQRSLLAMSLGCLPCGAAAAEIRHPLATAHTPYAIEHRLTCLAPEAPLPLAPPSLHVRFRERQEPGLGEFLHAEFRQRTRAGRQYLFPKLGSGIRWSF